jgi:hypothetical protein
VLTRSSQLPPAQPSVPSGEPSGQIFPGGINSFNPRTGRGGFDKKQKDATIAPGSAGETADQPRHAAEGRRFSRRNSHAAAAMTSPPSTKHEARRLRVGEMVGERDELFCQHIAPFEIRRDEDIGVARHLRGDLLRRCLRDGLSKDMDARGISNAELRDGVRRSTMEELANATLAADKVLVF